MECVNGSTEVRRSSSLLCLNRDLLGIFLQFWAPQVPKESEGPTGESSGSEFRAHNPRPAQLEKWKNVRFIYRRADRTAIFKYLKISHSGLILLTREGLKLQGRLHIRRNLWTMSQMWEA